MPVTTRSQAQTSMSYPLEPSQTATFSMSPFNKPLESDISTNTPVLLSMSLITEPLAATGSISSSSTSLIDECSTIHPIDTILACQTSSNAANQPSQVITSSLDPSNFKKECNFEISNLSQFETLESSVGHHSISHSSSVSDFSIMEDDDADFLSQNEALQAKTTQDIADMNSLFAAITSHLTNATQKLSTDFQQVIATNDDFKKEIRQELDEMRKILADQKRILKIDQHQDTPPNANVSQHNLPVATSPSSSVTVPSMHQTTSTSSVPSRSPSDSDMQAQMMLMLTESFTKLSSALQDKSESKSDWPKFAGDKKKFRSW